MIEKFIEAPAWWITLLSLVFLFFMFALFLGELFLNNKTNKKRRGN